MFVMTNPANKKKVREALLRELLAGKWETTFFADYRVLIDDLYEDEEKARASFFFPTGFFKDKDIFKELCKNCLLEKIDDITEWLFKPSRFLRFRFTFDYDVGFSISSADAEKTPSKTVTLVLRREKKDEKSTKFGFYISLFGVV